MSGARAVAGRADAPGLAAGAVLANTGIDRVLGSSGSDDDSFAEIDFGDSDFDDSGLELSDSGSFDAVDSAAFAPCAGLAAGELRPAHFRVYDEQQLGEKVRAYIERVQQALDTSFDAAVLALALGQFDADRARVVPPLLGAPAARGTSVRRVPCPVCLEKVRQSDTYALACGHAVCVPCFSRYVALHDRQLLLACPGSADCDQYVPPSAVAELHSAEAHARALQAAFLASGAGREFRACPHPDCGYTLERLSTREKSVACRDGHEFCFECGAPPHFNLACERAAEWRAIVDEEHRSAAWINEFTKQCPQCRTRIQKSEGCNHMVCSHCRYQFCWLCSLSWADHSGNSYYICRKVERAAQQRRVTSTDKREALRMQGAVRRYEAALHAAETDPGRADAHTLVAWGHAIVYCAQDSNQRAILEDLLGYLARELEQSGTNVARRYRGVLDLIKETEWA